MIRRLQDLLEMLGGSKDLPPEWLCSLRVQISLGLWWAALSFIILCFCGQASKFIYIDF
jgi:hypothetical protein